MMGGIIGGERATRPRGDLLARYRKVRALTELLARDLSSEDQTVQSMPDVSPTKWHRAHTSWFFETFVLRTHLPGYKVFHPEYEVLFNSYYNSVGSQFPRPRRGMLSRPGADEVGAYRRHVDSAMEQLFDQGQELGEPLESLIVLGHQHEEQHQELLLTDIKHVLSQNPLYPSYQDAPERPQDVTTKGGGFEFVGFEGGNFQIGHEGTGFHFDNELPLHEVIVPDFEIAARPLNNADVLAFIEAGGYSDPLLWLSDGWAFVVREKLRCPAYWINNADGSFDHFTMSGRQPLIRAESACHLSFFEAEAIARFFEARLPTEQEWECAARRQPRHEQVFEPSNIRPGTPFRAEQKRTSGELRQMLGGVWEWTQSPYVAYPGYCAPSGAVGEYNGKFMHNQMVLRGGSCATSPDHARTSYRNFFPSHATWQFTGARLARGLKNQ